MTYTLGLTGGIGSGKTTVAAIFARLGAPVTDADAIVHQLQAPGSPILDEIAEAFGAHLIEADGALDRAALGDLVFRDPEARGRLGAIIHPRVGIEMLAQLKAGRDAGQPLIVADIPLLLEGARRSENATRSPLGIDGVAVVWVPRAVQLERTVERDECTREEAQRRIDAQMPLDEKRDMADFVIDNSGSLADTEVQVRALFDRLVGG